MTELWELCGPSWRLPLNVTWYDDLAEVEPSPVPMLECQKQAIHSMLDPFTFNRAGKTWVCKADLVRVAHPSEHTLPDDVVQWLPVRDILSAGHLSFESSDFIAAYCKSQYAIGRDPVIMDAIWVSFCKFAFHWLINEEREIDFGFARMVPLWLRKNWSNCAAKWEFTAYRRNNSILKSDFLNPDFDSMVERGVVDYLVSGSVTSMSPGHLPRPILEIVESEEFFLLAEQREKARRRIWQGGYWKRFLQRLKRQLPDVMEVYAHHLKEAAHPICGIRPNKCTSNPRKYVGTGLKVAAKESSAHWGEDCALYAGEGASGFSPLREAHGQMQDVPDL